MATVRFTGAGTDSDCGRGFLLVGSSRRSKATGSPSALSSIAHPIGARAQPGGSASSRAAIRS